jgi:pyridoxal phosphate enzyme (YggS family)
MNEVTENLNRVMLKVQEAAVRSGRKPEDVCVVAVSKFHSIASIEEALRAGQLDFGENYPQELCAKAAELSGRPVRWHFTGHLQRNKIEKTIALLHLIHSVDTMRLLEALSAGGRKIGRAIPLLLQVNVSGEASKQGFAPAELLPLRDHIAALPAIDIQGLMTMAPLGEPASHAYHHFRRLRELRDQLRREWGEPFLLPHLSMGMSGDYEYAIQEGATIVRIGTEIFGARLYQAAKGA